MYDLIGDIHGHADELVELLETMGYRESDGAWRHPERQAVFVGDFIDRGPKIPETLRIVRAMIESGTALAVLGNHEWNAFAFHLADPDTPGQFLRSHSAAHVHQHRATLDQLEPDELADHLEFLRRLPIWLELPGANVVHACWDEAAFRVIEDAFRRHGGLTDDFLVEGSNDESLLYAALEIALKGKEMRLPEGQGFVDKDGKSRQEARVRWYAEPDGHTLATYTLPTPEGIEAGALPKKIVAEARPYPADLPPVFFGHYWLDSPQPEPLASNVVCLDYSVAKGGLLCGFRLRAGGGVRKEDFLVVRARTGPSRT